MRDDLTPGWNSRVRNALARRHLNHRPFFNDDDRTSIGQWGQCAVGEAAELSGRSLKELVADNYLWISGISLFKAIRDGKPRDAHKALTDIHKRLEDVLGPRRQ